MQVYHKAQVCHKKVRRMKVCHMYLTVYRMMGCRMKVFHMRGWDKNNQIPVYHMTVSGMSNLIRE